MTATATGVSATTATHMSTAASTHVATAAGPTSWTRSTVPPGAATWASSGPLSAEGARWHS